MSETNGENEKFKIDKNGYKRDEHGRFVKGTAPGPGRKHRDFITDFKQAAQDIAKKLNLDDWEIVFIELIKKGLMEGLKGNYNFWKDLAERIYGKIPDKTEIGLDETIEKIKIEIIKENSNNENKEKDNNGNN